VKRFNSEKEFFSNDKIELRYGSINKLKPNIIYVIGNSWIIPQYVGDYKRDIINIINRFKKLLRQRVKESNNFDNNMVCDFDVKFATLKENKKNCMSFEVFLKQYSKNGIIPLNDLQDVLLNIFKEVVIELMFDLKEKSFAVNRTRNF